MTRLRAFALGGLVALLALFAVAIDAGRRREARDAISPRMNAIVALTGTSDLALNSTARWLRHPSQAEPGAAFSDLPASLDVEPAGAWIGPPRAILRVGAIEVQLR
jgi:hypothetical protein